MTTPIEATIKSILQQLLWSKLATDASGEPIKPPKRKGGRRNATLSPQQLNPVEQAFDAIKRGDLADLAKLVTTVEQANWLREGKAWCLLDEAVRCQSLSMVRWLLDKGANPNMLFRNDHQHNHLCGVATPGLYFSPLATAIREGLEEIVVLLLTRQASLDLPIWFDSKDGIRTCRDMIVETPMWPNIEAELIAQEIANAVPAPRNAKRI